MSVMTFKQTNSFGDAVGTWDAGAKRLENVDFVRKAFESFDVDKSGFLDPQELRAALTMLGVKPSVDALKEMGIEDVDGDGVLSLQDLDADGDQKIDFEEVQAAHVYRRMHAAPTPSHPPYLLYAAPLKLTRVSPPRSSNASPRSCQSATMLSTAAR